MKENILKNFYQNEIGYIPAGQKINEEVILHKMSSTAKMFGQSLSADNINSIRHWIENDNLNRFGGEKIKENDIVDVVTNVPELDNEVVLQDNLYTPEIQESSKALGDISSLLNKGVSINDVCAIVASYGYGQSVAHSKKIFGDYIAPEDITNTVCSPTLEQETPEFNLDEWNDGLTEETAIICNPDGSPINVDLNTPTAIEKAVMSWASKYGVQPSLTTIGGKKYLKFTNGYYVLIGTDEIRSSITGLFKPFIDGFFGRMVKDNPKIVENPVFKVLNDTANTFLGALAGNN